MATGDHTAPTFLREEHRTKSLDRAVAVIDFLQAHGGEPVSVQEIAEQTGSYYEEILHVLTTLEALQKVKRFRRDGSPREGARVAYAWSGRKSKRQIFAAA